MDTRHPHGISSSSGILGARSGRKRSARSFRGQKSRTAAFAYAFKIASCAMSSSHFDLDSDLVDYVLHGSCPDRVAKPSFERREYDLHQPPALSAISSGSWRARVQRGEFFRIRLSRRRVLRCQGASPIHPICPRVGILAHLDERDNPKFLTQRVNDPGIIAPVAHCRDEQFPYFTSIALRAFPSRQTPFATCASPHRRPSRS